MSDLGAITFFVIFGLLILASASVVCGIFSSSLFARKVWRDIGDLFVLNAAFVAIFYLLGFVIWLIVAA